MIRKINKFYSNVNKINVCVKFKNLYYFKKKKDNLNNIFNISNRIFFLLEINDFLKKNNLKKKKFFKIIFFYYSFLWNTLLNLKFYIVYYFLIKKVLEKYKFFFFFNKDELFIKNYLIFPNNYLNSFNLNFFNKILINNIYIKNLNNFLKNSNNFLKNNNYLNLIKYSNLNFGFEKLNINFLKIQRRYNKRRYSKVRVNSRPSFFSGISLSSIFLGLLWGGTIKNVDWFTAWIVKIDINLSIFLIILYFFFRIWKLLYLNVILRKKNKIKTINLIHNMFIINFWIKNLK